MTDDISAHLRLEQGPVDLAAIETDAAPGFDGSKTDGKAALAAMGAELADLQERLWAERTAGSERRVLLVLQGMDTSGKGGVLRHTIGLVDPQGVRIHSFKAPTEEERSHDFLWRIEKGLPEAGYIGVFDRSHYEDVLIARVRGFADPTEIERRYGAINDFEARLADEGYSIIKCMLHVGPDEQKERLAERLANPEKHWKYNPGDLDERAFWPAYRQAYEVALERHLVRLAVGRPEGTLVEVAGVVLPVLLRVRQPLCEPLLLLIRAHVEHALDDRVALVGQPGLEVVDRAVAALDLRGVGEAAHPGDQHVLVVRAVEDTDVAGLRQPLLDAPEEVVRALLLGGGLEAVDPYALRVDQADGVAQHAALAAGVHPLQDEQHAALRTRRPLGPEAFLQVGELGTHGGQGRLAVGLRAVEAGRGVGLDRGQVDRPLLQAQVGGDVVGHAHIMAHPRVLPARARIGRRGCSRQRSPWTRHAAARRTTCPARIRLSRGPAGRRGCGGRVPRSSRRRRDGHVVPAASTPTAPGHRARVRRGADHRSRSRARGRPDRGRGGRSPGSPGSGSPARTRSSDR